MVVNSGSTVGSGPATPAKLRAVIKQHWGFNELRPLQAAAMQTFLAGRDSLLVLPTGGGKSLCYQAPAVLRGDTTVVISPLIALMKDQVDGLRACGVPAVQINSSQSPDELRAAERSIADGKIRLVFASPERMATSSFRALLKQINVQRFAIDEAHCISHWGHDFRPDYRQLGDLKRLFPQASIHAFTATATEPVRADIAAQLGLQNPEILVGYFDRPNLTYTVEPRSDQYTQILEVLKRHRGEAGIIYCIRRKDVEELTDWLKQRRIKALPYHAGMDQADRVASQDQFMQEKCQVVVATVAFGMGINRSNIRFVLHTGMPKSIEHYQQETGRAGRDGLEAECVLLYSGADTATWQYIIEKSIADSEAEVDPEYLESARRHLADMENFCRPVKCRHRSLVEYFGQTYDADNCGACDLCLGNNERVPESTTIAQKILSCVYRVHENFGVTHVTAVLRGANLAAIRERGHNELSTYGILKAHSQRELTDWISQLIGQGLLTQTTSEFRVLKLNPASWAVMRGQLQVTLHQTVAAGTGNQADSSRPRTRRSSEAASASWEGVDRELFEHLTAVRLQQAELRRVPPYLVFNDATLRELARVRPASVESLASIYGVGESKLRDFGPAFLAALDEHCRARQLTRDQPAALKSSSGPASPASISGTKATAYSLFRQGATIEKVMKQTDRARATVLQYLCSFLLEEPQSSVQKWVAEDTCRRVTKVAETIGTETLRPIFEALDGAVTYDDIKIVVAHLRSSQ
ncbi:MAG: DNA helicase RecQ [Planctomycetes bacterium]|nr:DNA helicase RecQ [Planctomycetota bacterium]